MILGDHRSVMWRGVACWGVLVAILATGFPVARGSTAPPPLTLADRVPIRIEGDSAFTATNGVTGGQGTALDPYTIEGWNITAASGDAITILNTSASFVLRNLTVHSGGQVYAGIRLYRTTNGRLENDLLYDCGPALKFDFVSNVTITNSTFASNYASAWMSSSTGITFTGNRFQAGGYMDIDGLQWFNFTANTATDHPFAIGTNPYGSGRHFNISGNEVSGIQTSVFSLFGIDDAVLEANRISATGPDIVVDRGQNVTVDRNVITGGAWAGIDVGDSSHVEVEQNSVSNVIQGPGISIELSANVSVSDNDLMNNAQGLALQGNLNVAMIANHLVGSGFSIDADTLEEYRSIDARNDTVNGLPLAAYRGCDNVTFDHAVVAQIFLVDCRHIAIRNQTFANLDMGVELIGVEDAILESTTFQNTSTDSALRLFGGANVTITRTNFTSNQQYGMRARNTTNLTVVGSTFRKNYLGLIISRTTNASLYLNNFIHNRFRPEEVVDDATNGTRWDAGYPIGGNYWSYAYSVDQCSGVAQDVCGSPDGIADAPIAMGLGDVDRYPLMRPYGIPSIPPVAQIDAPDDPSFRLTVTEVMDFNAWRSYDADGIIVAYDWDFGDGTAAGGDYVTHSWSAEGLYNMTLTVRDNSGQTTSASVQVNVSAPQPSAWVRVLPSQSVFVAQPVTFDGSQSDSNWGGLISWEWDFGDGTRGSGTTVVHQFASPGSYSVRLTVTNRFAKTATAWADVVVSPIPDIPLRVYENAAGFRLPIPSAWTLEENVPVGDITFTAVLTGPVNEGVTTNIVIDTGRDTTVREDNAYLGSIINAILSSAQSDSPGSFLSEGPTYRSIAGHAGVVFAITRPGPVPLVQKAAIVVSDEHDRFWLFIITAHEDYMFLYNATFDRMVDGFEITLPVPLNSWLLGGIVAPAGAIAAAVVVFLLVSRRKKSARRTLNGDPWMSGSGTVQPPRNQYCPACGAPSTLNARFCAACGGALSPPQGGLPTRPDEPPRHRS